MIGELITGGLGLIGSLFGSKKQKTTSSVDYDKMADEATAAGFNPLTAIRNGGSAGFTTTTGPTASMLPEALANLGGILGPALGKQLDPLEAKKRQLDTALVDYQLKQLKNPATSGTVMLRPGSTYTGVKTTAQISPTVGPSSNRVANVPSAYVKKGANKPGEGTIVGGDNPQVSTLGLNSGPDGFGLFHNPNFVNAEQFETIYGESEIGSTLYGGAKMVGDIAYSAKKNLQNAEKRYGPYIRDKIPKPKSGPQWQTRNAGSAIGSMFKPKRKARWEESWQKSLQ